MKRKRKGRIGLIVLCVLSLGCYFFRHDLLVIGFDIFLKRQVSKNFSRPLSYENMVWQEGRIVTSGLNISDEQFHLTIDQLEVVLSLDLTQWQIGCKARLVHPELTLVRRSDSLLLPVAAVPFGSGKSYKIELEIDNGVLQLNTLDVEERLYFSFVSGKKEAEIGTLFLSYDPHLFALPTTEISFSLQEEDIVAGLKVGQMESRRLLQLMSFFYPLLREGWENAQGQVEVMASATFAKDFSLSRLAGLIDARDVYLSNSLLGVQAQATGLHGEFTFPPQEAVRSNLPFWKQVRAYGTIEEGQWMLGERGVSAINAHLLLDPALDPLLDLSGVWIREGKEVPLTIQGKGSVLEDQSFWLELGVKLLPADDQESLAFVSICSAEKQSYVVQVEFNHLDMALLEMFGSPFSLNKGSIEGKLTGWVHDKELVKVQIDDVQAQGVVWTSPYTNTLGSAVCIQGEALFAKDDKKSWHILSLKGEVQEAFLHRNHFASPSFTASLTGEGQTVIASIECAKEAIEVHFDFQKEEGWLRADCLSQALFGSWIQEQYPQLTAQGEFEIFGTFSGQKVFLSLQGRDLLLDHPLFTFHIPEMVHPALLTYSFPHGEWQGAWTVERGTLIEKTRQLYCQDITVSCEMEGVHLLCKELSALCEGVQFSGHAEIDLKQESFQCASTSMDGPLSAFGKWAALKSPLEGSFITEAGGLLIEGQKGKVDWSFKAHLKNMEFPLQNGVHLQEAECDLSYDSKTDLLTLQEIESKLFYKSKPYKLHAKLKKKEWWEFDATVLDKRKEVARAVGIAQERPPAEVHFAFEKNKTHFLGTKLSINRFVLKDWTELLTLEMTPVLFLEELEGQLASLNEAEILGAHIPPFSGQGEIHAHILYEGTLSFDAQSPVFSINGKDYVDFSMQGTFLEDTWTLEYLKTEDFFAQGRFFHNTLDLFIQSPLFSCSLDGVYEEEKLCGNVHVLNLDLGKTAILAGRGSYALNMRAKELAAKLDLVAENGHYVVSSQKSIQAHASLVSGLILKDMDLSIRNKEYDFSMATVQAGQLFFDGSKWSCNKAQVELSKPFLRTVAPGCAEWIPHELLVKLEYDSEKALLKLGSKTYLKEHPLYAQLQVEHPDDQLLALLKVSDDPKAPGIKCLYKEKEGWTSVQGEITGFTLHLMQTAPQVFWGTVAMDPSGLSKYLPEIAQVACEKLRVKGWYQLEGNWDMEAMQFKGAMKAENFEVADIQLQSLQAALVLNVEECTVENLTLEDPAGRVLMKQMQLTKENGWECHAPLILVQDFHPSKLRTSTQKTTKPLMIKKLSIYNLEGILGDKNSFSARGRLNFTNAFKKEYSLLDIPMDALKNLGLDLGLLTPVYGEAEFQLAQGKFYLTDLTNTYSEGKRSEFYLLGGDPSFLDLEGNIRLDLKMKQHVMLNLTEPFTLSVRGTLEKPQYSLR